MKKLLEKWRALCEQDYTEHLSVPRITLFCWGAFLFLVQTVTILASFTLLLQISGVLWILIYLLFRQYYRIWKRYYSLVWPILAHVVSVIVAIYIKVRFL